MNEMELKFLSRSENETFARNAVAAFVLPLNPSLAELSDVKTAVSEAVTNAIVHGYGGKEGWITLRCKTEKNSLHIEISDSGKGIDDVEKAQQPFFYDRIGRGAVGNGLYDHADFYDEVLFAVR